MTDTVDVYLPNPESDLARASLASILPKSAIVGTPAREWFEQTHPSNTDLDIIIDFEGNKFGASNVVTYADRAMVAFGRHREHYPTVARLAVPPSHLIVVGTFYAGPDRIEPNDAESLVALMRWLDVDADQLARELLSTSGSGARARA